MATGVDPTSAHPLDSAVLETAVSGSLGSGVEAVLTTLGNGADSFASSPAQEPEIARVEQVLGPLVRFVRVFVEWVVKGFARIRSEVQIIQAAV